MTPTAAPAVSATPTLSATVSRPRRRATSRAVRPAQAVSTIGAASVVSHEAKNDGTVPTVLRLSGLWALIAIAASNSPRRSKR